MAVPPGKPAGVMLLQVTPAAQGDGLRDLVGPQLPCSPVTQIPEKPSLEGLETKWRQRWGADGTYRFDRSKTRAEVYSIAPPPPTVSGTLHPGHVFSYPHTHLAARHQRMRRPKGVYPLAGAANDP